MLTKAERHKPLILQRLKEGRNLAEIADELCLSPHALPHYLEQYKDEWLIEGDGRTVEGLSVEGVEVTFRPDKPCGFPNCERPKKRNSMNQLASKYCAEHLKSYLHLRHKRQRETNTEEFHYSYAEFEAEVLGSEPVQSPPVQGVLAVQERTRTRTAARAVEAARQCTFPDCPHQCTSRDTKSLHSRLCETHRNQYLVWRNAELAGHATAPAPKQKEGVDDEYVFRYTVKDFIRDATEPGDWERAWELSVEARRVLEALSVISHASAYALKAERPVLNTLLGRNFIRERGDGHYDITAQGRAAIGRDHATDTPPPAALPSTNISAVVDELNTLLSEYEAQSRESEVRWREIVEGIPKVSEAIAVTPTEGEVWDQNGNLSEKIAGIGTHAPDARIAPTPPETADLPEWDAAFDITLDTKMNGVEVQVRVSPFALRDIPLDDVVAYFSSIGTQVGWMLKFHNEG